MKKTLTTTFWVLLFTVALTFVAPIATFAQFTATWYDTGWESQSQDFTSLSDALSYDYNDVLMSMGVSITQTADYTSTTSSSVTIANGIRFSIVNNEHNFSAEMNITITKGEVDISPDADNKFKLIGTITVDGDEAYLNIGGGTYVDRDDKYSKYYVILLFNGYVNISGGTFTCTSPSTYPAIGASYKGSLNISGGTFTGTKQAIYIDYAQVTTSITGGKFLSTTDGQSPIRILNYDKEKDRFTDIGYCFVNANTGNQINVEYDEDSGEFTLPEGVSWSEVNIAENLQIFKVECDDAAPMYFSGFREALAHDYDGVTNITITQLDDYAPKAWDAYFQDGGVGYNNPITFTNQNVIFNSNGKSIQDTLMVKLDGGSMTFNCNDRSNLYAKFILQKNNDNNAKLTLNGGNYDFFEEIVNIGQGCEATIKNTNFVTGKTSGRINDNYGWHSTDTKTFDNSCYIVNSGTLTIDGGDYSYCDDATTDNIHRGTGDGYGVYTTENGNTTIKKGTFHGLVNNSTGNNYNIVNNNSGTVTIQDGTFENNASNTATNDNVIENTGTLTIENGTFKGGKSMGVSAGGNVEIKNGSFSGSTALNINGTVSNLSIKGGEFVGTQYGLKMASSHTNAIKGGAFSATGNDGAAVNITDPGDTPKNTANGVYFYDGVKQITEKYNNGNLVDATNSTIKSTEVHQPYTPYVVLSDDKRILYFKFDGDRPATAYDLNDASTAPDWATDENKASVEVVQFTSDFVDYTAEVTPLASTYKWFEGFSKLTAIVVPDGKTLTIAADATTTGMFAGCTSLIGDAGTKYDESNPTDGTYARVDQGPSNPGYFTEGKYKIFYDGNKVNENDPDIKMRAGVDVYDYDNYRLYDDYLVANTLGYFKQEYENAANDIQPYYMFKDNYIMIGWTKDGATEATPSQIPTDIIGNYIYKPNWVPYTVSVPNVLWNAVTNGPSHLAIPPTIKINDSDFSFNSNSDEAFHIVMNQDAGPEQQWMPRRDNWYTSMDDLKGWNSGLNMYAQSTSRIYDLKFVYAKKDNGIYTEYGVATTSFRVVELTDADGIIVGQGADIYISKLDNIPYLSGKVTETDYSTDPASIKTVMEIKEQDDGTYHLVTYAPAALTNPYTLDINQVTYDYLGNSSEEPQKVSSIPVTIKDYTPQGLANENWQNAVVKFPSTNNAEADYPSSTLTVYDGETKLSASEGNYTVSDEGKHNIIYTIKITNGTDVIHNVKKEIKLDKTPPTITSVKVGEKEITCYETAEKAAKNQNHVVLEPNTTIKITASDGNGEWSGVNTINYTDGMSSTVASNVAEWITESAGKYYEWAITATDWAGNTTANPKYVYIDIKSKVSLTASITGWTYGEYKATANKPSVSIEGIDAELEEGTDFTATYTDSEGREVTNIADANAGDYTLHVTLTRDEQQGEATAPFTIAKVTPTATAVANWTYDGAAHNLVSPDPSITGVTFTYKIGDDESSSIPQGTNAGTYNVYYKVTSTNPNYQSVDYAAAPISVTVDPKTLNASNFTTEFGNAIDNNKIKNYDEDATVTFKTGANPVILTGDNTNGILREETVKATITAAYNNANPGNGKTITYTVTEVDNTNYTFGTTTATNTATSDDGVINAKITFNKNGHGTQTVTSPQYFAVGSTIDVPELSENGYQFDGWYTEEEFRNKWTATSTVTGNTTLYAKWSTLITTADIAALISATKTYDGGYWANAKEGKYYNSAYSDDPALSGSTMLIYVNDNVTPNETVYFTVTAKYVNTNDANADPSNVGEANAIEVEVLDENAYSLESDILSQLPNYKFASSTAYPLNADDKFYITTGKVTPHVLTLPDWSDIQTKVTTSKFFDNSSAATIAADNTIYLTGVGTETVPVTLTTADFATSATATVTDVGTDYGMLVTFKLGNDVTNYIFEEDVTDNEGNTTAKYVKEITKFYSAGDVSGKIKTAYFTAKYTVVENETSTEVTKNFSTLADAIGYTYPVSDVTITLEDDYVVSETDLPFDKNVNFTLDLKTKGKTMTMPNNSTGLKFSITTGALTINGDNTKTNLIANFSVKGASLVINGGKYKGDGENNCIVAEGQGAVEITDGTFDGNGYDCAYFFEYGTKGTISGGTFTTTCNGNPSIICAVEISAPGLNGNSAVLISGGTFSVIGDCGGAAIINRYMYDVPRVLKDGYSYYDAGDNVIAEYYYNNLLSNESTNEPYKSVSVKELAPHTITLPNDKWTATDANDATNTSINKAIYGTTVTVTYSGSKTVKEVKVYPMPKSITINTPESTSLSARETLTLTATISPTTIADEDNVVKWTSSDDNVATVSEKTGVATVSEKTAVVTGVSAGEVTITATTTNGKTAEITLTVQ